MSCQFPLKLAEEESSGRTNGRSAEAFSCFAKSPFKHKPKPKIVSTNTNEPLSYWEISLCLPFG